MFGELYRAPDSATPAGTIAFPNRGLYFLLCFSDSLPHRRFEKKSEAAAPVPERGKKSIARSQNNHMAGAELPRRLRDGNLEEPRKTNV